MSESDGPANPTPEQPELRIDWSSEPTPAYANGAHTVHSTREFSIFFSDFVDLPGRGAETGGPPNARIVSSVRLSPEVFLQFVVSVASNWNRFVQRYGDPENAPRFKLIGAGGVQLEGVDPPPGDAG